MLNGFGWGLSQPAPNEGPARLLDHPVRDVLVEHIAPRQVNDLDVLVGDDEVEDCPIGRLKRLVRLELEAHATAPLRVENDVI